MVIWIIGLSGSGKTFLANSLKSGLNNNNVIIVDGDEVRKHITYKLGYSHSDRKKNSTLSSNLCKFLESKGYVVICPILSIFNEHQKKNRKKFKKYIQIYIKSDLKILKKRNNKSVYKKKKNIVGKDIKFPEPYKSHFTIKNSFKKDFENEVKKIIKLINAKK